jgi:hypothetical protein
MELEMTRAPTKKWHVSHFTKNVPSQSYTANEIAARAACEVLKQEFPEESDLYVQNYET